MFCFVYWSDCLRPKPFTVVFDTGSGHLILPSSCPAARQTADSHEVFWTFSMALALTGTATQRRAKCTEGGMPVGVRSSLDSSRLSEVQSSPSCASGTNGVLQGQPKTLIGMDVWPEAWLAKDKSLLICVFLKFLESAGSSHLDCQHLPSALDTEVKAGEARDQITAPGLQVQHPFGNKTKEHIQKIQQCPEIPRPRRSQKRLYHVSKQEHQWH